MKRICMLAANDLINDPRVSKQAKSAAKAGFDVIVIGVISPRSKSFETKEGYKIIRIKIHGLFYNLIKFLNKSQSENIKTKRSDALNIISLRVSFWEDFKQLIILKQLNFNLANEIAKHSPDIIHSNDLDTLLAGYLSKRKLNVKLIYDMHELYTHQHVPRSKFWINTLNKWESKFINSTDYIISVSSSILEFVKQKYSINTKTQAILNCPDHTDDLRLERPKTLPGDKKIVLYQGRYEESRGLEEIIKAAQFFEHGILILRGYGNIEDKLKTLAKDLDILNKKVFFLKPIAMNELVKEAAFADIGILPYKDICLNNRFCLPNKVFEYMMSGLAIAVSDLVELRKLVDKTNTGVVFNPNSFKNIAEKINELIKDENKLQEYKKNSIDFSKKEYNWEKESEKLISIYKELADL